jgi:hypothetical protein
VTVSTNRTIARRGGPSRHDGRRLFTFGSIRSCS